ncbi:MAG: hypothetical protein N4A45_11710 [Flavobacteriales bacterium]|jgi:hypothetical protein|nr:hypothetical protein [Flavobacteriales bacterium]
MTKNEQYDILIKKFNSNEDYRVGSNVSKSDDIKATVQYGKKKSEPFRRYFSKPENVEKFKKMLSES